MFNDPNPNDTDNANLASQKSNSSISISNINQLHKNANNTDEEDEKKWQHLMENHHEQCDFEKCAGKRTNGLYVCQYSNIPGSMYSQFLRYRRRQGAYKTKPCRNFYGGGYCHAGDQCSFYHTLAEQRNMPPELTADYDNSIQSMHHGYNMVQSSGDGSSSVVGGSNNNGLLYYNHNHHPRNGVGNFGLFNEIGHGHGFNGEQLPINRLLDGLCKQVDTTVHKLYKHVFANYENMNPNFYNFTGAGGPSATDVFNAGTVNFGDGKKMRQDTNVGTDEAGKMVQTIQLQPYNLNLGGERWPPFSSMDNMSLSVAPMETQTAQPDFAAAFYHHVGVDNSTSASPGVIGFSRAVGANVGIGNNNKNANTSSHGAAKQRHFSAGQLDFGKSFHPFGESYPLKDTGISIGALNNE